MRKVKIIKKIQGLVYLTIIIGLGSPFLSQSQSSSIEFKIDSIFYNNREPNNNIKPYIEVSNYIRKSGNLKVGTSYLYNKLNHETDKELRAQVQLNLVPLYGMQGISDTAIFLNQNAIDYFSQSKNHDRLIKAYSNMGILYQNKNTEQAITYQLKSDSLIQVYGSHDQKITITNNLVATFLTVGNMTKAKEYIDKQNELLLDNATPDNYGDLYTNTAKYYYYFHDTSSYHKALAYYIKADSSYQLGNDLKKKLFAKNNIATMMWKLGQTVEAIPILEEIVSISQAKGLDAKSSYYSLLKAYHKKGDNKKAKKYLDLIIKGEPNSTLQKSDYQAYRIAAELYLEEGDNSKAAEFMIKSFEAVDSFLVDNHTKEYKELETKYQTTQKEAENELLKKDQEIKAAQISRQKNLLLAALLGLGGLGFGFYMLFKRNRERQLHIDELASKNKKIETLNRETIHRTKNYLNLASNLLAESNIVSDDERISKLIEDNKKRLKVLSMVNNRLSTSEQDFHVNINEYITELVEDLSFTFKNIKRIPLDINYEIDSLTLDSDKSLYLGLIINELITNSIKHAKTDNDQPLHIKIQLSNVDGLIKLHYSDNGESTLSMPNDKNLGLGLIQNLCDQIDGKLNHVFKNGYHFSLSFR